MFTAAILALALISNEDPTTYTLETTRNVWDVTAADIDGNGATDILALCSDEETYPLEKNVSVFLAPAPGIFGIKPDYEMALPSESGAAFLAEVDGQAPPELVVTNVHGAEVYSFQDGKFVEIAAPRFSSLLPSGSRHPRFLPEAAHDLNKDGTDEWLIPVPGGYVIRTMEDEVAMVRCDVSSEVRSGTSSEILYISHRVPKAHVFETGADSEHAIAFLTDEFADFAYGDGWEKHKRFEIPINLADKWDTSVLMDDLSGDGLPDLVVTQTEGTLNVTVLTQVYIAQEPYTYPEEPSATFQTKGAFAQPVIMDVNGDERLDMVYLKVPFGLKFFANFLLRKKVGIKVEVYLYGDGGYPQEPNYTTGLTIDAPDGREEIAYTFGDFNGDGRIDASLGSGSEKLEIYLGEDDRLISKSPWKTFDIVPFGVARTHRLDTNTRDDLIIHHPSGELKRVIDVVIF